MEKGKVSAGRKNEIAYTAIHRVEQGYDKSLRGAILRLDQYSCFNEGTDNSIFLKDPLRHNPKEFFASLEIAIGILEGKIKDPKDGATYYYDPKVLKTPPEWTKGLEEIKRPGFHHRYYKERRLSA